MIVSVTEIPFRNRVLTERAIQELNPSIPAGWETTNQPIPMLDICWYFKVSRLNDSNKVNAEGKILQICKKQDCLATQKSLEDYNIIMEYTLSYVPESYVP